jgi:hypothetical protein
MIKVRSWGRLGNNLFQYALGRFLAEEMGYELSAAPLPFPATHPRVSGQSFREPRQVIGPYYIDVPTVLADKTDRAIVLEGWFQHYKYYAPFWERICQWFHLPTSLCRLRDVHSDDAIIYIRLGDYSQVGMNLDYSFYNHAIHLAKPRRLFIVTEDKNHPFLHQFSAYSPTIISGNPWSDLGLARCFKKIVLSCSTFSWWAAMLADPEEVYFPIAEAGHWSPQRMHSPHYDQDLRIDDPRFVYFYNCPIKSSNRPVTDPTQLSLAHPDGPELQSFVQHALEFHRASKAYWLE